MGSDGVDRSMDWPSADGEMATRIRAHEWASTPLGPIKSWPQSLRTAIDLILGMPGPATILWGPAHIQIYNDAYIPIARDRHPALLGRPVAEGWDDIYETVLVPLLDSSQRGRATRLSNYSVPLQGADGQVEERLFDSDWSPVRDETGAIAGALQTLVETTDRQAAQTALRESEARHRLLIESWTQAVWEADANGDIVTDSQSWREYTGQKTEEWLGYGWLNAIHPDDRADVERKWRDALAAPGLVDADYRFRGPDGGWRWTNVRAAPVLDAEGRIEKWVGMNIDIDDAVRAEQALRESEKKYRRLFECMDEAYAVVEVLKDESGKWKDFRFLEVNPAFIQHTSMPYPVGKTATELLGSPNPRWTELYGQALDTGEPIRVEEEEATLGRTFDLNIFPIGRDHQVAVLFQDISERKRAEGALRESEARFRALATAGTYSVYRMSADWQEMRQLHGGGFLADTATPDPRWADAYILPDDQAMVSAAIADAIRDKKMFELEHRVRQADGSIGWVHSRAVPMLDEQGEITEWFGAGSDVTARKRAEAALVDSESKYRTLFETMGQGYCELELVRDADGRAVDQLYLEINPAFERLFGIPATEARGRKASDLFPDLDPQWTEMLARVATAGTPERIEHGFGDDRWFEVFAYPGKDDRLAVLYEEISDRKRAQQILFETQQRQAFLLRLSDALRGESGVDAVANRAIELLLDHLQLDRAYITFYRPEQDEALIPYQSGNERVPTLPAKVRLSDFPDAYEQVQHHTYVIEDDVERRGLTAEERANSKALGMRAMLASTIRQGEGTPLCSMMAVSATPRRWSPGEIALVEDAAERTWQAMERAKAEATLRENEERLSLAVEVGQFASWDWDLRTGEVRWNDRHFLLQGYAVGEVKPSFEAWIARVHPDDRDHALAAIEEARLSHQPYANEMRTLHSDGTVRWCSARGSFFYDQEGKATRMIGIMEDVTDRKLADRALQQSEARFRHFGEASSDLLWIRDAKTLNFEYVSPAFESLYGLSRDELLAHDHLQAWLDLIDPEDRQQARDMLSQLQEGEPAKFEFRIRRPDGQMRWVRNTDFPLVDDASHVRRIAGIAHDITGEKRAVELQATLLAELQHRVRNLLAMIRSVIRRASVGKEDVADFVDHLEGRIDAMARTQSVLTRSPGRDVDLRTIFEEELLAQSAQPGQYLLNGPETRLAPKVAEVVTLAIHELATNSVKYGAIGRTGAFFFVTWDRRQRGDETRLTITWRETGVPITGTPGSGFGTELLTRRVPFELGGDVRLEFLPEGLTATLDFPLRQAGSVLQTDGLVRAGE